MKHYPETGGETSEPIPGLIPLAKRLAAILTEAEMKAEDIEISAGEHRRLGEILHLVSRFDWAADCFQRANELDPDDESSLRSLSEIRRQSGDLVALDRTLERLLAIVPDDVEALQEQLVLLEGRDDERIERNEKRLEALGIGLESFEEEIEISGITKRAREYEVGEKFGPGIISSASVLTKKAEKQLILGEVGIALETVSLAIEADAQFGPAWSLKARLMAAQGKPVKEAVKCLRRANALGEYTVIFESEILEKDGRSDAAIEVLAEHLERTPIDSEARGRLSQLWLSKGSIDSSKAILDDAPEECWDSTTMNVMKGRLSLVQSEEHRDETGKLDPIAVIDSLVSFDRAIEIDRESGLAWLGRARALRYQGALDEAEVALVLSLIHI